MTTGAGAQGPAKRKRTKGGRYSHEITKEEIELYYHLPCEEASRQLGIGLTILKRICRRLGIEKWPYRQLKRAGKLGEAAAAAAANTGAGTPASMPPTEPGAAAAPAGAQKSPAACKRPPPRKKPSMWEPRDQSTTQEEGEGEEEDEDSSSRGAGSRGGSGSEGSWQAVHRSLPDPAGGPDLQPATWPSAAIMARQGSEPLAPGVPAPQPAAGGRRRGAPAVELHSRPRRVSIDIGVMAYTGGPISGARQPVSPQLSGSTGGTSSGGAAGSGSGMQRQPSGALKRRIPEDEFDPLLSLMDNTSDAAQISPFTAAAQVLPEGVWTPGSDGGGPWQPVQDPGADQLAQGLSRLAMRTLSLKRQCSRAGEGLDPLEAALLMERLEAAQAPLVNMGGLESIEEPGEEGLLPLGDPNLSNLLYGASPRPRHGLSSSDLVSEGCLLPEATAFAPVASLHHAGSFGVLLECGTNGGGGAAAEPALQAPHTSSSGSALPQPGGSASDTVLPLEPAQSAELYGLAAGVTAVGPASAAKALQDNSYTELPSPFSIGSGPTEQDREVDDMLADFLSPAPSNLAEARMAELLGAFSPKASPRFAGMDDPALAGLSATQQASADIAGVPAVSGGAIATALRPSATAALAAAAVADPPAVQGPAGSGQGSPLTQPTGGSGSILSHNTATSSGTAAMSILGAAALDMPLSLSGSGLGSADLMPLVAHLAQDPDRLKQMMAGQLMQMQAQQAWQQEAAAAAAVPAWAADPSPHDLLSPGAEQLQQAVEQHQAVAQQYLQQREEVQPLLVSDISSAFSGGTAPRLGPPPPLPGTRGVEHAPARSQGQADGMLSITAMLQQWRCEAGHAAEHKWSAAALPAPAPAFQAQLQPHVAQRAASAPLPWDLDLNWAATA
ncbi:hypothetical protein ABPG75_000851 [Micractinium tetrahymenae]